MTSSIFDPFQRSRGLRLVGAERAWPRPLASGKKQDNSLLGMLLVARDFPVARVQNTILPGHYQNTAGFEFTVIELGLSFDFGYGKQPVAFLCWGAASRVSSRHRRCVFPS